MPKFIFSLLGLGLTVAFGFFYTGLIEFCYYDSAFSSALYDNGLYLPSSLASIGFAWLVAFLFYYVINKVQFHRWWHWLLIGIISLGATAIFSIYYTELQLDDLGEGPFETNHYVNFMLWNVIFNFVIYVAASFSIRWWSSNCNATPIPL